MTRWHSLSWGACIQKYWGMRDKCSIISQFMLIIFSHAFWKTHISYTCSCCIIHVQRHRRLCFTDYSCDFLLSLLTWNQQNSILNQLVKVLIQLTLVMLNGDCTWACRNRFSSEFVAPCDWVFVAVCCDTDILLPFHCHLVIGVLLMLFCDWSYQLKFCNISSQLPLLFFPQFYSENAIYTLWLFYKKFLLSTFFMTIVTW